jgi:hypothetical protein
VSFLTLSFQRLLGRLFFSTLIAQPDSETGQQYRGAGKALAPQGRKKATATKLEKKFKNLSVQPGLRSSNDFHVGRKMATHQLFFSVGSG